MTVRRLREAGNRQHIGVIGVRLGIGVRAAMASRSRKRDRAVDPSRVEAERSIVADAICKRGQPAVGTTA